MNRYLKTSLIFILMIGSKPIMASKTAGGANGDPLILYLIGLVILGGLIGFPYLIRYIKKLRSSELNADHESLTDKDNSED